MCGTMSCKTPHFSQGNVSNFRKTPVEDIKIPVLMRGNKCLCSAQSNLASKGFLLAGSEGFTLQLKKQSTSMPVLTKCKYIYSKMNRNCVLAYVHAQRFNLWYLSILKCRYML